MKYEQKFRIGIREIGLKNEITNYGILSFLEDIATYHSDTCGYGVKDIQSKGAWLLMDWELEVKNRPPFGENITVKTYAVATEKTSFHCYRNFELYNSNNELFATATSKWVFYNFEIGKITKINSDIIDLFNPEGVAEESEKKLLKLKEPPEFNHMYEYIAKRTDIDINMHMNNLNYLKLTYETIPEISYKNELNNLRIMYKNQIKLGEKVKCLYSKQDDAEFVVIKSNDEKVLHAIIKIW